ncbi:MAG: hypothetical protein HDR29_02330, partial [Lachnospiraceae bacterium]|nr:hypothetical protein [Lachnospiraceae bacterium]
MKKRIKVNRKIVPWLLVTISLLLNGCSSAPWAEETMQAGDLVENITQNEELGEKITQSGNGDKNAAVTIKLNEDITHIWNMYEYTDISDIDTSDDEVRTELTTELLNEKNLDTSIVTDPIET